MVHLDKDMPHVLILLMAFEFYVNIEIHLVEWNIHEILYFLDCWISSKLEEKKSLQDHLFLKQTHKK